MNAAAEPVNKINPPVSNEDIAKFAARIDGYKCALNIVSIYAKISCSEIFPLNHPPATLIIAENFTSDNYA